MITSKHPDHLKTTQIKPPGETAKQSRLRKWVLNAALSISHETFQS